MIELKLGKMTYEELAEWRGVSLNNLLKNFKSKFEEEFKEYCEFIRYKEKGKFKGIKITKIYNSTVYIKKKSKGYQQLEQYCLDVWVPEKQNGITTNAITGAQFIKDVKNPKITESTACQYASKIFFEHFGDGKKKTYGTSGTSERVLGVSINSKPRLMTQNELNFYYDLLDKYLLKPKTSRFKDLDREQFAKDLGDLEDYYKLSGEEISNEELKQLVYKYDNYSYQGAWRNLREEFYNKVGGWPICGKYYEKGIVWHH